MTATLTFTLPEELEEHQTAIDGWKWKNLANELSDLIRGKLKHGHEFKTPDEALEFTRRAIFDLAAQNNLLLD